VCHAYEDLQRPSAHNLGNVYHVPDGRIATIELYEDIGGIGGEDAH
jgi:hypothetical protein